MEGLELVETSLGVLEAFYTSGGAAHSVSSMQDRGVKNCYYKTLRYQGHRDAMRFLMYECGLDGEDLKQAIIKACQLRIRPIIMTSLSTMIAMVPLLIGNIGPGAGEGSRLAVGATIFGGMIISTFFTLYVTPSMYLALAKNTKRIDIVDLKLKEELSKK